MLSCRKIASEHDKLLSIMMTFCPSSNHFLVDCLDQVADELGCGCKTCTSDGVLHHLVPGETSLADRQNGSRHSSSNRGIFLHSKSSSINIEMNMFIIGPCECIQKRSYPVRDSTSLLQRVFNSGVHTSNGSCIVRSVNDISIPYSSIQKTSRTKRCESEVTSNLVKYHIL